MCSARGGGEGHVGTCAPSISKFNSTLMGVALKELTSMGSSVLLQTSGAYRNLGSYSAVSGTDKGALCPVSGKEGDEDRAATAGTQRTAIDQVDSADISANREPACNRMFH